MIKEVGAKVVLVDVDPKTRNIDLSMVEKGLYSNTKAIILVELFFFFSSRRRHTRLPRDWSSDVCSSDLFAPDLPALRIDHLSSPSPFTALGAKGLGEGNTMSAPVAIANAVADALGRDDVELPLTPPRVWALLHGPRDTVS